MALATVEKSSLSEFASIVAEDDSPDAVLLEKIMASTKDESLARRIVDWLPEAFGWVLASKMQGLRLPNSFHVRAASGEWYEFPLSAEPIFSEAVELASEAFVSGQRVLFERLALRSSIISAITALLNKGADLEGSVLSGPAFVSLAAELYLGKV